MREAFMDSLGLIYAFARPYNGFCNLILTLLGGRKQITDLATGTGESVEFLLKHLDKAKSDVQIVGTDLFPNVDVLENLRLKYPENFNYVADQVNVFDLKNSDNEKKFYTIFTAFHHFHERDAVDFLRSAVGSQSELLVFEMGGRFDVLKYLWLPVGFFMFMLAPFTSKKWKWGKFIVSTIIPIIPVMVVFDGIVSNLRTYTENELRELAHRASPEGRIKVDFHEQPYQLGIVKSYMCRFYYDDHP